MSDSVGRTRLVTRNGMNYAVTDHLESILRQLEGAKDNEMLEVLSVTGQGAFPPERLFVRVGELSVVQEISAESWVWQQRAAELHYARQIADVRPEERYAQAAEMMAQAIRGEDDD